MSTETTREEALYTMVRWGNLNIALQFAAKGVSPEAFETAGQVGEEAATVPPPRANQGN
jgi:hypothetical protein